MATNRFFDNSGLSVVDGQVAKASQLNSLTGETNKAFDLIQSELDTVQQSFLLAYEWAQAQPGTEIDQIGRAHV